MSRFARRNGKSPTIKNSGCDCEGELSRGGAAAGGAALRPDTPSGGGVRLEGADLRSHICEER